jgi:hypothetical protein
MSRSLWGASPIREGTLFRSLNSELSRLDRTYVDILPDFSGANTLLIGSDYSGESFDALYTVFSFLLTSLESWSNWEPTRLQIRKKFFSDSRRMSFKKLTDGQRRRALPHFLEAANSLNGLSISVALSKKNNPVFEAKPPIDLSNPQFAAYKKWKTDVLEKAFLIMNILGVLLAGLSNPGQDVMWFTDEDTIAANDERVCELTQLFAWISSLYLTFTLGRCRCGTSKCDDGSRQIEDFLAIPDIIAGALSEQLSLKSNDPIELSRIFWMHRGDFSDKTGSITWWLADSKNSLKRLIFTIDPEEAGNGNIISVYHFYDQKA